MHLGIGFIHQDSIHTLGYLYKKGIRWLKQIVILLNVHIDLVKIQAVFVTLNLFKTAKFYAENILDLKCF